MSEFKKLEEVSIELEGKLGKNKAVKLIAESKLDTEPLITHIYPLAKLTKLTSCLKTNATELLKSLLNVLKTLNLEKVYVSIKKCTNY